MDEEKGRERELENPFKLKAHCRQFLFPTLLVIYTKTKFIKQIPTKQKSFFGKLKELYLKTRIPLIGKKVQKACLTPKGSTIYGDSLPVGKNKYFH